MLLLRIIVLLTLCFASTIHAAESDIIDRHLEQCLQSKDGKSTGGMADCAAQALNDWEAALATVSAAILSKLDGPRKARFKETQAAWQAYQAEALQKIRLEYQDLHGSMYIPMQTMDILEVTKTRVLFLEGYLHSLSV